MLSTSQERLLRYWGLNMAIAMEQTGGVAWPLFGYSKAEQARFDALAGQVPGKAMLVFMGVTVVVFIALAALAVVFILLPILTLIAPNPADLKPLPFVLTMAMVIVIAFGLGFPLSLAMGARLGDAWGGGTPAAAEPGDVELHAKIRRQLLRFTLVAGAVFIPGCLLWILFDINAGPLIDVLKVACAASTFSGMFGVWRTRPKRN
jgi:hypothetical protein